MNGFYVSMIFLGILLIIISLISIFLEKRKAFHFVKGFDEKKQELSEIINDAEQMIDELNRFSDYIVTQMDLKNEELNKNLREAEERVQSLNKKVSTISIASSAVAEAEFEAMDSGVAYAVNSTAVGSAAITNIPSYTSDAANAAYGRSEEPKSFAASKKKEKVIPFNNRYSEVLRLAGEGLESLEIARKLHMGKGEVELIIGLRK